MAEVGDADSRSDKSLNLLVAYYGTVRQEILQRSSAREATTTLFLGASAAVASVAVTGSADARWLLFVVPVLGLGAASIYLQHTLAIRAFWLYLATDFEAEVRKYVSDPTPRHWDVSEARLKLRASAGVRGLAAALLLIVPQALAAIVGFLSMPRSTALLVATGASGLAILVTAAIVSFAAARPASGQALPRVPTQPPAVDPAKRTG